MMDEAGKADRVGSRLSSGINLHDPRTPRLVARLNRLEAAILNHLRDYPGCAGRQALSDALIVSTITEEES